VVWEREIILARPGFEIYKWHHHIYPILSPRIYFSLILGLVMGFEALSVTKPSIREYYEGNTQPRAHTKFSKYICVNMLNMHKIDLARK
jgi:hypothetical protein